MIITIRIRPATVCLIACLCAYRAPAIEYVFPPGANVVDITKPPYSADRTGQTDVSAILSKAANDIIGNSGWAPGTLYMPNGTYLVKNTFGWKMGSSGNGNGPHVIGQSRSGTVIKLAKGTWPLGTELRGVIQTGAGVEQNFGKGIINLTVLADSNNAGAIGIIYASNNTGLLSDVDIISADGKGAYGIQSAGGVSGLNGNGPFIIRRTFVKGFSVGIRTCGSQSAMVSQISLEGQSKYGIWASCGDLTIGSLTSRDTCIAVEAEAAVLLTNAVLTGGSPTAYGVRNFVTSSFFRDVKTTGYKFAISSVGIVRPPLVSSVDEYSPSGSISLFSAATKSMNIPARFPPEPAWETDFTKWAFIDDYKTNGRTDAQALQAAIDDPAKTTVCLPRTKTYQLDQTVTVRGAISRIFGAGGILQVSGSGQLVVGDGSAPRIMLQNIFPAAEFIPFIKSTNRTLIIEGAALNLSILGGGETYVTDWIGRQDVIDNPQARVWLWQWGADNFTICNGIVRFSGWYHESTSIATMIHCRGGFAEFLGLYQYCTSCNSYGSNHIFEILNNANVSVAGLWQQNFCNPWVGYTEMVTETRGSTTKILYGTGTNSATHVVSPAGASIALFTAYDSAAVKDVLAVAADFKPVASSAGMRFSAARGPAGIVVTYSTLAPTPATILAYDLSGRIISIVKEHPRCSGICRTLIPGSAGSAGVVCVEVRAEGESMRSVVVP